MAGKSAFSLFCRELLLPILSQGLSGDQEQRHFEVPCLHQVGRGESLMQLTFNLIPNLTTLNNCLQTI